jgi:excisionase family DNA binding protein
MLAPVESAVTIEAAADLLNVPYSYVVGMIDKGLLNSCLSGDERRLQLSDVLSYKVANRAKRRETLREMVALDQELGLI